MNQNMIQEEEITKIIPQIPDESDASYKRLLILLEQELGTLEDLFTYLETEEPEKQVSISQLRKCSAKDNWTERRQKYQDHQDKKIRQNQQQLFKDINDKALKHMKEYIEKLEQQFHQINIQHEATGKPSSFSMYRMYHEHILCYREAIEMVYITTRHKLEPDEEETEEQSPKEIAIESVILSNEYGDNELQMLRDVMEGNL